VGGVGVPAGDLLQRDHRRAQGGHRVDGQVRVAGVPAAPGHGDLQLVGRGVDRARGRADGAGRQLMLEVRGDHGQRLVRGQRVLGHDVPGPGGEALLAGLQHGQQGDRQVRPEGPRGPAQRGQRGQVHVVAAGVHRAVL
jgi:hypothetical protein